VTPAVQNEVFFTPLVTFNEDDMLLSF
jgi:hypothetical protein